MANRARTMLKSAARVLLPSGLFQRVAAVRSRRWQVRLLREGGFLERVARYIEEHGTAVQAGPFAGMIYPLDSATSRWSVPKLLGTYESEIHPFLEAVSQRSYDCVIDIGSAEGYYAAGLARIFRVPVYAYDPEPREKEFSAQMFERNGVTGLVTLADMFTVDDMQNFAAKRALVVCDCEGFEEVLFRPDTLHLTRNWDLMVELHGAADTALPRLAWPHRITVVDALQKTGLQDEMRHLPQRYLLCDSQAA